MGFHKYLSVVLTLIFCVSINEKLSSDEDISQDQIVNEQFSPEKESLLSSAEIIDGLEFEDEKENAELFDTKIESNQSLAGFIELETAPLLQQSLVEEVSSDTSPEPTQENTVGLTTASLQMSSLDMVKQTAEQINKDETVITRANAPQTGHIETMPALNSKNEVEIPTQRMAIQIEEPYDKLPISDTEKQVIGKLLTTMADCNVLSLWFQRKELEGMGMQIQHVHPIRFLGTVFSNQKLVYAMNVIHQSTFKWDGFIEGFSKRLEEEFNNNNIEPYILGLANHVNVNTKDIKRYLDKRNFEGLVVFLINSKLSQ